MTDTTANDMWDLHDPNWEERFDRHFEAYRELQSVSGRSPEQQEQYEQHERGWKDAHVAQFKNASEYANFMISWIEKSAKRMNLPWIKTDTSQLKTREDAVRAFNEASKMLEEQKAERFNSLPIDRYSGLFAKERTRSTHAYFPGWGNSVTETIVTSERTENELNICLTHLRDNRGTSVINTIEDVATTAFATSLCKVWPNPKTVNWYIHVPATESMCESFMKVDMTFGERGYANPRFDHLETVPEAVKMARYNANQEKTPPANALGNGLNNGQAPKALLP